MSDPSVVAGPADRAQMEKAIEDFASKIEGADVALFYYAGHGMQHQGVNYCVEAKALQRCCNILCIVAGIGERSGIAVRRIADDERDSFVRGGGRDRGADEQH